MKTTASGDIFHTPTGRAIIVAMDHGIAGGAVAGLESLLPVVRRTLDARPDGLLLSPGMTRHAGAVVRKAGVSLWVTLDHYGPSTVPGADDGLELHTVIGTPGYARDLGASGVKAVLVFGYADPAAYAANLRAVAALAEDAHRAGLPLMVEAVLWGRRIPEGRRDDPAILAHACRVAVEVGADLVKTTMPSRDMRAIVEALPVPIVILGGPRAGAPEEFLQHMAEAIGQGARGVVCGRTVWQSSDPAAVVRGLRAVVHGTQPAPLRGA